MVEVFFKNNRGQVGDTLTWAIATLAIIFILGFTMFLTVFASVPNKVGEIARAPFGLDKALQTEDLDVFALDFISSNSVNSYLLKESSDGKNFYSEIKDDGDLNFVTGEFASLVFKKIYSENYGEVWFGIDDVSPKLIPPSNDYFGTLDYGKTEISFAYDNIFGKSLSGTYNIDIWLDEENIIKLYLEKE